MSCNLVVKVCQYIYIYTLFIHLHLCTSSNESGIEKNNHNARRNYQSSDIAVEMLIIVHGLEHDRAHQQYTKRNHEYWFGGIQGERKKRQILQYTPLIWL